MKWLAGGGAALLYRGGWYHNRGCLARACEPLVEALPTTYVVDAASVEHMDLMAAIGVGDVEAVRTLVE